MDIEPTNDAAIVDPNTDDLEAFSDLLSGKAKEQVDDVEVKPAKEPVETTGADTQPAADADKPTPDGDEEDGADSKETTDTDEGAEKPVKKVSRYQERINELTAKARDAERALQALQAAQANKQPEPVQPTPKVVTTDGPTPDDQNEDGSDKYPLGEFDPQYIRDLTRHTIQKETAELREQEAQETQKRNFQEARNQLQEQWVEKLTPVTEKYDDFLDKTMMLESAFDGLDPQFSDYLVQTIKSLDHGPEVLYYFANHLDEAKDFVRKGPLEATLALGKYDAMFSGDTKDKAETQTKVSNAPVPPQLNKGSKTRISVAADTDDLDAFSEAFFNTKKPR